MMGASAQSQVVTAQADAAVRGAGEAAQSEALEARDADERSAAMGVEVAAALANWVLLGADLTDSVIRLEAASGLRALDQVEWELAFVPDLNLHFSHDDGRAGTNGAGNNGGSQTSPR